MNKRLAIAITVGIAVIAFLLWVQHWYNSPDQKLQRCETAEEKAYVTPPGGVDPPMMLFILDCKDKLGIK